MLRSYLPKGHPLKSRELGSEKTPALFVANMVKVFRLVRDCMADHATCWLNMGDSYVSTGRSEQKKSPKGTDGQNRDAGDGGIVWGRDRNSNFAWSMPGVGGAGNLCLIPQRLAIALQDDGWLVRSVVIWHKPACMPQSVAGWRWMRCRVKVKASDRARETSKHNGSQNGVNKPQGARDGINFASTSEWSDCPGCAKCKPHGGYVLRRGSWRPTSSYEPILMLAKKPGYYADGESVKTPAKSATVSRDQYTRILDDPDEQFAVQHDHETTSAAGANLRDVWTIAAEPLKEKHYAAYPTELVRLCLRAGTSEKGYCPECGKPWARVIEGEPYEPEVVAVGVRNVDESRGDKTRRLSGKDYNEAAKSLTLGWRPTCQHEHEPRPALVLDPFAGSGRTGVTAQRMFLDFVGCELNEEYCRLAKGILSNDSPLFSGIESA